MPNDHQVLIHASVQEILQNCLDSKILELTQRHSQKLHFIPTKYRIFGGLLQSMNIQFGNFIEVLMKNLIAKEPRYKILEQYSGQKKNKFALSKANETLIDQYITQCQTENLELESAFKELCAQILQNDQNATLIHFTHDIDLLFKDQESQKIYYLEIKYNDDHDTRKRFHVSFSLFYFFLWPQNLYTWLELRCVRGLRHFLGHFAPCRVFALKPHFLPPLLPLVLQHPPPLKSQTRTRCCPQHE